MVNIDRCNPHKQKLFGVLSNSEVCKGVLRPKILRTTELGDSKEVILFSSQFKKNAET